ncbi:hypothetical protein EDB84DRAFT_1198704 [Lactarius hengduanensis]|nr:hypothetical protein EDB84DRAFT_1198704 [Lactarius hengduanensis]
MEQSRAKRIVRNVAGRTDLEDGLRKLDKLTNEEVAMASVQLVKVTHNIDNNVSGIDDGVKGVDVKVQVVNDNFKAVGDRVQTIAEDGKATATEVKSILRQTADDVVNVKRSLSVPSSLTAEYLTRSQGINYGTALGNSNLHATRPRIITSPVTVNMREPRNGSLKVTNPKAGR